MIITSTQKELFKEGKRTSEAGIALEFGDKGQQIRGFGCCFSELSARALNTLSEKDKRAILDELFLPENANFNYCRTPIGASDFATSFYSYNENDGDYKMEKFSIERDRELLLPLILEGVKRQDKMQMFASPWCPPLWLKTHHTYSYGVFDRTPEKLEAYALYFKKYVQAYRGAGVPLVHIHPQNEPCSNQVFPSCVWRGDELADFIGGYLGPMLEGEGVDIFYGTINGPEGDSRYEWTKYSNYLGYAMQCPEARKYIKGVGYQWAGKFALPQTRDDYPELEIIQTESECGDGKNTWDRAIEVFGLARHYFRFGASAYVYWNLALMDGEPSTWGWHQNSLVTVKDKKATLTPEFYLMKHLSAFVKRGARYVEMRGEVASSCIAFENPDGQRVLAIYNPYTFEQKITVAGQGYKLPPRSINTIVIEE